VRVDAPGGRMIVRWPGPGERLWLTGPAVSVFEGTATV
jgi:diaminopimelate epimerase